MCRFHLEIIILLLTHDIDDSHHSKARQKKLAANIDKLPHALVTIHVLRKHSREIESSSHLSMMDEDEWGHSRYFSG